MSFGRDLLCSPGEQIGDCDQKFQAGMGGRHTPNCWLFLGLSGQLAVQSQKAGLDVILEGTQRGNPPPVRPGGALIGSFSGDTNTRGSLHATSDKVVQATGNMEEMLGIDSRR